MLNVNIRLPSWIVILEGLLNGSKEEITPNVRRASYRVLAAISKHCSVEDEVQNYLDIFWHGLADIDRSVRLASGYV